MILTSREVKLIIDALAQQIDSMHDQIMENDITGSTDLVCIEKFQELIVLKNKFRKIDNRMAVKIIQVIQEE